MRVAGVAADAMVFDLDRPPTPPLLPPVKLAAEAVARFSTPSASLTPPRCRACCCCVSDRTTLPSRSAAGARTTSVACVVIGPRPEIKLCSLVNGVICSLNRSWPWWRDSSVIRYWISTSGRSRLSTSEGPLMTIPLLETAAAVVVGIEDADARAGFDWSGGAGPTLTPAGPAASADADWPTAGAADVAPEAAFPARTNKGLLRAILSGVLAAASPPSLAYTSLSARCTGCKGEGVARASCSLGNARRQLRRHVHAGVYA